MFSIPMRMRFRGITVREGMLIRGDAGWGEWSPFLEYDSSEAAAWLRCAEEAAAGDWPEPVRDRVPVNVTVPVLPPDEAHALVARSGCRTAKVKVADATSTLAEDQARLEAVRDALGPGGRIRVDANGAWDVDTAVATLKVLERAAGGLEYVEQPCATVEELAAVRRRTSILVAADESIRRAADPYRVRDLEAADIAVLKVQPLGGVRACLRIAEDIGLPTVVSSALETSVGLAAGVALAAALPELEYACGLATVRPAGRRRRRPAARARRRVRAGAPSRGRPRSASRAARPPPSARRTGGRGWPRSARWARIGPRDLDRAGPSRRLGAGRGRGPRGRGRPGSRNAPLTFAAYDAAAAGLVRLHTRIDERSAGFLALGLTKVGSQAAVICTSGTAVANLHPAMLEAAHAGVRLRRRDRRPAGPAAGHGRQPDHRPGRRLRAAGPVRRPRSRRRGRRAHGPRRSATARCHLNVQLDDPLVPDERWDPSAGLATGASAPSSTSGAGRIVLGPRTVVVAGDDAGPPARVLAEKAGWPLLAEPTAGPARATPRSVPTGCCSTARSPTRSSGSWCSATRRCRRPVTRLLARDDVEVLSVAGPRRLERAAVPGRRSTSRAARRRGARRARLARPLAGRGPPRRRRPRRAARRRGRPDAVRGRRRRRRARSRPAGCSSSAPPTRSATWT